METHGKKMLTLGDSITNGFNGETDLHRNYPFFLQQFLQLKEVDNAGQNAGMLSGFSERDLTYQVKIHDFSHYDIVSIAYGTNDYSHSDQLLSEIQQKLAEQVQLIKRANPAIMIVGILPINRFDQHTLLEHQLNSMDYNFNDLLDALTSVYQSFGIPVLNWRTSAPSFLTINNYQNKLNDHRLHPNQATYYEMGQIIAHFIQAI